MMLKFIKTLQQSLKLTSSMLENANDVVNKPGIFNKVLLVNTVHSKSFCSNSNLPTEEDTKGPNFAEITQGDPELEHKLKILMLELDIFRQEGGLVPQDATMKTSYWKELLTLRSISARKKYLQYLFKIEKTKENRMRKKEEKRLDLELNPRQPKEDNALNYSLGGNNIFLRFYDTSINNMYNNRLIQAMQFNQKLIIDCGYNEYMTNREIKNCAKQMVLLFAENRFLTEPFDLHFCNVDHEDLLMKTLDVCIPTMHEPWFPINLHTSSYLDLFPKDKLVYLTPHCRDVLQKFDHDSLYIIGAIVDKVNHDPLSLAKAKKEGIRMAKLPLDNYLEWGSGSGKSLTINQVLAILADIKLTGDWKHALRHVPRRKLVDFTQEVALKKFNQAIGYTAEVENRKINPQRTWKPSFKNEEKIGYKSNVQSSIDLKDILKENK